MKLHTPDKSPDWAQVPRERYSRWHQIAIASRGIVTPGNILSVTGLAIVIWGSMRLYHGAWVSSLFLIVIGRLLDIADGYAADLTKTKSQLGEVVDTICDKATVFIVVVVAYATHALSPPLLLILILHHLYVGIFGAIWGRRYHLHASRYGKLAMLMSWIAIVADIVNRRSDHNQAAYIVAMLCIYVYVCFAIAAIITYHRELKRAIAYRLHTATWTKRVTRLLYIQNRRATNYRRSNKLVRKLGTHLNLPPTTIAIAEAAAGLREALVNTKGPILIAIGGGDGTISSIINILIDEKLHTRHDLYVLPLWGGNANDLANTLNGFYLATNTERLLSRSGAVPVPLIALDITEPPNKQETIYACCYATFGASAYAARQLEAMHLTTRKFGVWLAPVVVVYELFAIIRAFIVAPMHGVESSEIGPNVYEQSLINGPRIAKVNRVPIELDEPAFFHAVVKQKTPSILLEIFKVLLRRPSAIYDKRTDLNFVVSNEVYMQVDGEVRQLAAGSTVNASVYKSPIKFISTKLPKSHLRG